MVEEPALERAEQECSADADARRVKRELAELYRDKQDQMLALRMAESIRQMFPGCPLEEARAIARHTSVRGSGGSVGQQRVGRWRRTRYGLRSSRPFATGTPSMTDSSCRGLAGWKPETPVRDQIDRMLEELAPSACAAGS